MEPLIELAGLWWFCVGCWLLFKASVSALLLHVWCVCCLLCVACVVLRCGAKLCAVWPALCNLRGGSCAVCTMSYVVCAVRAELHDLCCVIYTVGSVLHDLCCVIHT